MRVKLTRPFYDNQKLWPAGTELDLEIPPKSAISLEKAVVAEAAAEVVVEDKPAKK